MALAKSLVLARDCHQAYLQAGPKIRRLFTQAFFEKLYIDPELRVEGVLAGPFGILLDPDLTIDTQVASGVADQVRRSKR